GEVYTREGDFRLTDGGALVNEDGLPVAWEHLRGAIDPVGEPMVVDEEGNVRQGVHDIGRLKIVDFADKNQLHKDRLGFWSAPARLDLGSARPGGKGAPADARVHQYALEESNSSGVEEMVDMISVQRSFEVVAKTFQSIDQSYERLTRPF